MQNLYKLKTQSLAAGSLQWELEGLPSKKRVRKINIWADLSGTKGATDTLDGKSFYKLFKFSLPGFIKPGMLGSDIRELMHQQAGRIVLDPTDLPGSGETFDMEFLTSIDFRNPDCPGSDDGSIPTELLMPQTLEIFVNALDMFNDDILLTAGSIYVDVELVHDEGEPMVFQYGYLKSGGQEVKLEQGVYSDLVVRHSTEDTAITSTLVSHVTLECDGEYLLENITYDEVLMAYNADAIKDSAAELPRATTTRLPVVWQPKGGKANMTKQPAVEGTGRLIIEGSLTAPRVIFKKAVLKSAAQIDAIKEAVGMKGMDRVVSTPKGKEPRGIKVGKAGGPMRRKSRIASKLLPAKFR